MADGQRRDRGRTEAECRESGRFGQGTASPTQADTRSQGARAAGGFSRLSGGLGVGRGGREGVTDCDVHLALALAHELLGRDANMAFMHDLVAFRETGLV